MSDRGRGPMCNETGSPASASSIPGRRYWVGVLGIVLPLAYLTSGFYVVNADEHAVVRRFGAIAARVGPGMHYRMPWPVDRVDVLKTTSVMKVGVGFALRDGDSEAPKGVELLTGDTNILNVALVVQYIIRNPADYLFQVDRPQTLVATIAESVLTETVVGMPIDEVLTTGRLAIQAGVKLKTQEMLDQYQSGVQISSVNIMNITLDPSVAQAFQDVADAMADREKTQNEARAYANDQIPRARGEANQTVSNAQNYKQQRIAEAIGNTTRFQALLQEYQKAPEVTRSRIYLDSMEKILPKVKLYVIDSQGGHVPINLRVTAPGNSEK
ncbi:MAG TPA: FtsH protease activity modulator HflK [Burkholderiales bacterium]|nr:FtsH protease activity modulator HflK [Burkholderiales bacterium]